jgi:hypothetical protein
VNSGGLEPGNIDWLSSRYSLAMTREPMAVGYDKRVESSTSSFAGETYAR